MKLLRAVWLDQSIPFPFHPNRKMNFVSSALISYLLFNVWSIRKETKHLVGEIVRCSEVCRRAVRCPNVCTGKMVISLICVKMRMCDLNVLLQMTEWKVAKTDLEMAVNTRVGTLIVATIYLQLIQNTYMFRSFTVLQCSHQHCV